MYDRWLHQSYTDSIDLMKMHNKMTKSEKESLMRENKNNNKSVNQTKNEQNRDTLNSQNEDELCINNWS